MLGSDVRFEYRPGWKEELELLEALEAGIERDLQHGSTHRPGRIAPTCG